jgi:hypothetical protein
MSTVFQGASEAPLSVYNGRASPAAAHARQRQEAVQISSLKEDQTSVLTLASAIQGDVP